jgi:argininosuccinate lyase
MLDKFAEGYNDMYFVDDALPNVEAVKNVLDQLDVKGKSVQARIQFSRTMSDDFNKMLERTKGVPFDEAFSRA